MMLVGCWVGWLVDDGRRSLPEVLLKQGHQIAVSLGESSISPHMLVVGRPHAVEAGQISDRVADGQEPVTQRRKLIIISNVLIDRLGMQVDERKALTSPSPRSLCL